MEKIKLKVDGMACGHCELAVQDAVRKLPGIMKVKANRKKKEAAIEYDSAAVSTEQMIKAINDTGYSVKD